MTTFYREDFGIVERRLRDAFAHWEAGREHREGAVRVYARRVARGAAGAVGTAGALVMGIDALRGFGSLHPPAQDEPAKVLVGTWIATALAYVAGRLAGALVGAASLRRPDATGDGRRAASRVEAAADTTEAEARADRLEQASVALPMMAVALLGPLSLHAGFVYLLPGRDHWLDVLGGWIRVSVLLVGLAHGALACYAYRFARLARTWTSERLRAGRSAEQWEAFGVTVVASAIPGVVLFLVPPLLTAATGLVIVPGLYRWATGAIVSERLALGAS